MFRRILILLVVLSVLVGCRNVPPVLNHTLTVSWTPPKAKENWIGCAIKEPCSYIVSKATLAAGSTSCPLIDSSYVPLNVASPVFGTSYTDSSSAGLTVCFVVVTVQGNSMSIPSLPSGPTVVPANSVALVSLAPNEVANGYIDYSKKIEDTKIQPVGNLKQWVH